MARLLNWPRDLVISDMHALTGPRAVDGASTESLTGFVQTTAGAFGVWRYQFTINPIRGDAARRHRGMVIGLHGGANAVRVPFYDPDIMSWKASGVNISSFEARRGVAFSNGLPFSNGCNWRIGRPVVAVAADVAVGESEITLTDNYWGHSLDMGDSIGFFPFHFGKYDITQVIDDGHYLIWPPLRKALTAATDFATLRPVMAMRPESEAAATLMRGSVLAENNTMTMVEVPDSIVRKYFAD